MRSPGEPLPPGALRAIMARRGDAAPEGDDMDVQACDTCNTPLDGKGTCVTCAARKEGLLPLTRSGYASVKEMMGLLEERGFAPEIEPVPPRRPEETVHPLWNLYVPEAEVAPATDFLQRDWSDLLGDPVAAAAAQRGIRGVDLDAGGEVECPACGHRFVLRPEDAECPDCGLSLGAPAEASPDEAE